MQDEFVSKTKRKQEMHELQALGAALVDLPQAQLDGLSLEDNLRKAILEAKRISSHGARRRQLQYIGRLMRDVDPAPIRAKLDEVTGSATRENAQHRHLETLRARLLADEDALNEFCAAHPSMDVAALRALIRNSLREKEEGRPPRAYRELFRLLKSIESSTPL